jgi:amidase
MKINEKTILEMGKYNSVDLVDTYMKRIEEIDKNGPSLNSVLELNPDARSIAEALDKERELKGPRSLLHGIPVMIKGNIDTADKMETNAGSLALKGHIADEDAFIVKKLRDAGAVIFGKTNLSEWANFRSTRSSSGWSSVGGQTLNPYDITRSPCGSSSGSAVAVAANLCAVSVGTETDGSIVCPAQTNGIVGIKPTIGLVSRSGIIPIAHNQDTAGPMGRTVADAVSLLDVLVGCDSGDEVTEKYKWKGERNYSQYLDKDALKGARIGVARDFSGFHEKVDSVLEEAISLLKKGGAIIIDPVAIETKDKYDDEEFEVLLYEFKEDLNKYLSRANGKIKSLKELIEFNLRKKSLVMPYFEQEILVKAEAKGSLTDSVYIEALKKCREFSREKGIDQVLIKHSLKAIIAPTGGPAWKIDLVNGDHFGGGGSSQAPAVSGYPNITVPAGFISGLPIGLSFIGTAFSEPDLIGITYGFL